jgi:hypothetical protein
MPCQSTIPTDLWFGVWIQPVVHDTLTPLTEFSIAPNTIYEFDIVYQVDENFEDPLIAFPFDLSIGITMETPLAVDDFYQAFGENDFTVLSNDLHMQTDSIIISVTQTIAPEGQQIVTINPDGKTIHFVTTWVGFGTTDVSFTYTVTTPGYADTTTATVYLHH